LKDSHILVWIFWQLLIIHPLHTCAHTMLFTSAAVRCLGRSSSLSSSLQRSSWLAAVAAVTTKPTAAAASAAVRLRSFASLGEHFDEYGKAVFTGAVAEEYLSKHGGSAALLKDPTWVNHSSDTVANAVFDWYVLFVNCSLVVLFCCCTGLCLRVCVGG
jgi:hypothetical protein